MCGRFSLTSRGRRLRDHFALAVEPEELPPRYNIAPTQPVEVIPNRERRVLRPARWGLIPHWAAEARIGQRLINVRDDTVRTREGFRMVLERRRCLIPADGFYEWRRDVQKRRVPYYVSRRDGEPLAFAGIWDLWRPAAGEPIASCAIVTTAANELLAPIHDRMPVILPPEAYAAWLTPVPRPSEELAPLLVPCPPEWLVARPVSTYVNSPDHDGPECIAPLAGESPPAR